MIQRRGGIAPTAIAVIVVIVVVVAGVGAYVVLTSHSSSSSSSSSLTSTKTSLTSSTPTTTSSTTRSSTPTTTSSTSATSSTANELEFNLDIQLNVYHHQLHEHDTNHIIFEHVYQHFVDALHDDFHDSTQPASVIIPLLNAYSAITQTYQGAVNGTASSFTASYQVLYVSSTTYKVNITYVLPSKAEMTTVWLLKDGTVIGLEIKGYDFNDSASQTFQNYFGLWRTALGLNQQIETYTSSSFLKSTGTSTVTLGPSTFTVTNYTATSLPETIPGCNGESLTVTTAGSFSVGTPIGGSSYPLVIDFEIAGSEVTVGISGTPSTTTFSFTCQITSVTVA